MARLCVFCGSSFGNHAVYRDAARRLARALHARGAGLVFGGSHLGLMGVVADSLLELGGEVIGVIPGHMVEREIAHTGLTQLIVVQSMHERKAAMAAHADAFMALPGGFGTLDELMEILTWSQLQLHAKPIGLLDVDGYWKGLLDFVEHMTRSGFVRATDAQRLLVGAEPRSLLDRLLL